MQPGPLRLVSVSLLFTATAFSQSGPFAFELAKLTGSESSYWDQFGASLAMSGNTLVVGVGRDGYAGETEVGSAYIFVETGHLWTEQAKLMAPDAAAEDYFGESVAVYGDTVLVGCHADDNAGGVNAGSAFVFLRDGTTWSQQAKLVASDAASGDFFGVSVALEGDTAVIGADRADHGAGVDAGAAYVFVRSGGVWTEQAKLVPTDSASGDGFSWRQIAISGDTILVAAQQDDHAGGVNAGSAYVFVRTGTSWSEQAKLTAPDAAPGDWFGSAVALSGDTAIIGSPYDDNARGQDAGSVYVFVRDSAVWTDVAKLTTGDSAQSYFGASVALLGDTALVGAPYGDGGLVCAFVRLGPNWTEEAILTTSDTRNDDLVGYSVAMSADTAFIGAPGNTNDAGSAAGAAYAFALNPGPVGTWSSLGFALSGTELVPLLTGKGSLLGTWPVTLDLSKVYFDALTFLVVGIGTINAPFKGGVMVPSPDFVFPLQSGWNGHVSLGAIWPPGVPSGFSTYFQWWIQDPWAPFGFAASNAISGTTP